jgi:hypothetical protein
VPNFSVRDILKGFLNERPDVIKNRKDVMPSLRAFGFSFIVFDLWQGGVSA